MLARHRYETFLLRAALEDDPNCCWCPRPGCGMAMIANGGLMLVCPSDKCKCVRACVSVCARMSLSY